MYYAHIDEKQQRFVVEDRGGNLITQQAMPQQQIPNPGKDRLMQMPDNVVA